jgi:thioesterase domain-containing protein
MSHFYGTISVSARKHAPTARAHHSLIVEAQSWQGKIVTKLIRADDGDHFQIWREPHGGSGGESILLTSGRIDMSNYIKKEKAA